MPQISRVYPYHLRMAEGTSTRLAELLTQAARFILPLLEEESSEIVSITFTPEELGSEGELYDGWRVTIFYVDEEERIP